MPQSDSMRCPLCGATLTAEHDRDAKGRYHCAACSPTSVESQKGWLPTMATAVAKRVADAPRIHTAPTAADPMFAVRSDGEIITRRRTCECGQGFTQRLLSERFCLAVEAAGAMRALMRQIPDLYVPVHCPRCERIDLGRQEILDVMRVDERRRERASELSLIGDR